MHPVYEGDAVVHTWRAHAVHVQLLRSTWAAAELLAVELQQPGTPRMRTSHRVTPSRRTADANFPQSHSVAPQSVTVRLDETEAQLRRCAMSRRGGTPLRETVRGRRVTGQNMATDTTGVTENKKHRNTTRNGNNDGCVTHLSRALVQQVV